jgi:hypothetical protein
VLGCASIDDELIEESVPAVAVVTAIFYGAVADAPTLVALEQSYGNTKGRPYGPAKLLGGLSVIDDSESGFRQHHMPFADRRLVRLLVEHVKTGNLLTKEFSDFWLAATQDLSQRRAMSAFEKWLFDAEWAPSTLENLINRARENQPMLTYLDDSIVKRVAAELRELGAGELANEFLLDSGKSLRHEVNRGDSLSEHENESPEPAGSQVRQLIHDVQARRAPPIDTTARLERCNVEDFSAVLSTDDAEEFKSFILLLLILREQNIRFDAKPLGQALHQTFERDRSKRREYVIRAHMPAEDNPLDRILAVARGEPWEGWPRRDRVPS